MTSPSGAQHRIAHGGDVAVITEIGATLRSYERDDRPICWAFPEDRMCTGGRGQVLAPWPNRLRDGRYEFEGSKGRAAIDEIERMVAIHGLVRWVAWDLVERDSGSVELTHWLRPQPGYPFSVKLNVRYLLDDGGLAVMFRAENTSDTRIPFGLGFHPYLSAGPGLADSARVSLPARARHILDDRALPIGIEDIHGTQFERICGAPLIAEHRPVGELRVDDCFTRLESDSDGRWRAEFLPGGSSSPVTLWADAVFKHIMCFTGDTLVEEDRRLGVAIEPMTCPPDAFRSGADLVVLEPGGSFNASWGISPG